MNLPVISGRLVLMPNALDLGHEAVPLTSVLPTAVIQRAAAIRHWVVEDARSTRAFLKRVETITPLSAVLQSMQITELPRERKGSGQAVAAAQWRQLLKPALEGHELGLLSEAGLPAVADPGAELVAAAHGAGVQVEVLAGASSLLMALAASGLNGQSFAFVGYLPQDHAARIKRIRDLENISKRQRQTQICIETPYRNAVLFKALLEALEPNTSLSYSAGLSLAQARTRTLSVAQWRQTLQKGENMDDRVPTVFSWLAG